MTVPDLTLLSLRAPIERTLWEHLIYAHVAKEKDCDHFVFPVQDDSDTANCAQEGFLMCRPVPPSSSPIQPLGRALRVQIPAGERELAPVPRGDHESRKAVFDTKENKSWIRQFFNANCVQVKEVTEYDKRGRPSAYRENGIWWNSQTDPKEESEFFDTLVKWTDFMYLDGVQKPGKSRRDLPAERGRGLLFMKMFESDSEKSQFGMPYVNEFGSRYMYVILVCASTSRGFGSELMQIAIQAASATGCDRIALSTLPNAAGFYMGKFGFKFVSRNGLFINTEQWVDRVTDSDGRVKLVLVPERDVIDSAEQGIRDLEDRYDAGARPEKRKAEDGQGGRAAAAWRRLLSWLSYDERR